MVINSSKTKKNILNIIFDFSNNPNSYVERYGDISDLQVIEFKNMRREIDRLISLLANPDIFKSNMVLPNVDKKDFLKLKRVLELSFYYGSDLNVISMDIGEPLGNSNTLLQRGMDYLFANMKSKNFSVSDFEEDNTRDQNLDSQIDNAQGLNPPLNNQPRTSSTGRKKGPSFFAQFLFLIILFGGGFWIYNSLFNKSATRVTSLIQEYRSDSQLANDARSTENKFLEISGSAAVLKPVDAWREEFLSIYPDLSLTTEHIDSTIAINKLLDGEANIAAASRIPNVKERQRSQKLGMLLSDHKVAMDAVAVFVHPNNPLRELSVEKLKEIFSGEKPNWSSFGAYDSPIKRYSQIPESGTYQFFKDRVLVTEEYSGDIVKIYDVKQLVKIVENDESAIAFASLSNVLDRPVKILGVSTFIAGKAVSPINQSGWINVPAIKHGEYPLTRYLYLVTAGEIDDATAKFIDYFRSEEGQRVLGASGLVSIY